MLNGTASSLTLEAQLIIFINIAMDLAIIWIRLVQVGRNDSTTTSLSIRVRDSKLPADGFDWSWTIPIFSLSPYSSYVNEVIFALREVQHASDINHHVPYAMTYRLPSMWFFFSLSQLLFLLIIARPRINQGRKSILKCGRGGGGGGGGHHMI